MKTKQYVESRIAALDKLRKEALKELKFILWKIF